MRSHKFYMALLVLALLVGCTPTGSEVHEQTIYYVATTGSDANPCTDVAMPCLTVRGALEKSDEDDRIIIAAGTYNETSAYSEGAVLRITESKWIDGAGSGVTIIDAGGTFGGIFVLGSGSVRIEGLTIRNAGHNSPGWCINIREEVTVTIEDVEATQCSPGGIVNSSTNLVTLNNVSVSQAIAIVSAGGGLTNGIGIQNLADMEIRNAVIGGNGAWGVSNRGTLLMSDAIIQNNNREGVLLFGGETTLIDGIIRNNSLDGSYVPGVRLQDGARATIRTTLIEHNREGIHVTDEGSFLILEDSGINENEFTGFYLEGGEAELDNVEITGNGTTGIGSGIVGGIENEGRMTIRNSHLYENRNGGIFNDTTGRLSIYETTIENTHGGPNALFNMGGANIQNSLITNNTIETLATSLAAVDNRGNMTLANVTVSGNSHAGVHAGDGSLFLSFVTIAENGTEGLTSHFSGASIAQIHNVLIAKNLTADCHFDSGSPFPTNTGVNIDTDDTCHFTTTYSSAAILLDILQDNGGSTLTHALLPGSPALDVATGICIEVDQRVFPRPFGPACDVGAFEFGGVATSLGGFTFPTQTPENPSLTVTQDFPCYTGPGSGYNTLSTLKAGDQLQIVGYGFGGGWLVAFHPFFGGRHCWIDEDFVTTTVPVGELRLISVPPKPTNTPAPESDRPQPTVCVTNPNNQLFCK